MHYYIMTSSFDDLAREVNSASKSFYDVGTNKQKIIEPREINEQLKNIIDIVTIDQDVKPVGTFGYNIFKYPGDIDLFEKLRSDKPLKLFLENIVSRLKNIIQSILLSNNIFFVEFKTGIDQRFNIVDYTDITYLAKQLKKWHEHGFITREEGIVSMSLIKNYHDAKQSNIDVENSFTSMMENIREYRMLRWTASEILEGKKKLRGTTEISLYDALNMKEVTKLDTLIWYDNRYIEMTNFFYFEIVDPVTNVVTIISKPFDDYIESINKDIRKYAGCDDVYKMDTLKMLKRTFLLHSLTYKNTYDTTLLDKMWTIVKIVNDAPGMLSQIKADFEALESVLKLMNGNNIKNICIMLNNMTKRFNNNIDLELTLEFNFIKDKLFIKYAEYQVLVNSKKLAESDEILKSFIAMLFDFIRFWLKKIKYIINEKTNSLLKMTDIVIDCNKYTDPIDFGLSNI
jgi:hypothetical protein